MSIFKFLFLFFVFYIGYKLVFEFIIPVYRTTRQIRQKMSDAQQKMHKSAEPQVKNNYDARPSGAAKDDYIEYEEVK